MPKHSTFDIQHSTPKLNGSGTHFDAPRSRRGNEAEFSLNVHLPIRLLTSAAAIFGLTLLLSGVTSFAQDTQRQYLSGHDKDDAVLWEFQCTSGANSGFWTNLPVPAHWDMHGFGTLSYHKDATNALDEKGLYAHNFTVPKNWAGQRVFLVFEGVMTDTDVRLNGESVGPLHQGGFYRFKYEVTQLVKFDTTNRLAVTVAKHSANKSVNDAERLADFWVFGGIYRPVYLEAVPPQFIERVAIDAKADGNFSMDVFANGLTDISSVEMQIAELNGQPVANGTASIIDILSSTSTNANGSIPSARLQFQTKVTNPRQWTAETPNLYSVEVRLKRGETVLHRFNQRFGFRTFEVRDGDGLYLNGQRVILKGADRHSFWPDSGRCLSEAVHRLDIETMKDMNMNAVRMSHYPPDEKFLYLCDELGLYVLDELAGWHHHYDNEIGAKLVAEMIPHDVNHPSILFWDNGNEGGFNTNLDHLFSELDPQHRRVLHPWAAFSGVNTAHYLDYGQAVQACEGTPIFYHANGKVFADTNDPAKYIYMPTEFQHGLFDGGAGAGLDDYWKLMSASKYLGGGFIWVLEDDAVKRPDTGEMDTAGNQAPDGIVGPYRQREGSFYTIKEIWSPIQVAPANPGTTTGTFNVENHFSFTDANKCQFSYAFRWFRNPNNSPTNLNAFSYTIKAVPAIPPGKSGKIKLKFPNFRTQPDALALRVSDPSGRELCTWVWPLSAHNRATEMFHEPAEHRAAPTESADSVKVNAGELAVTFSKQTGLLVGLRRGAQTFSLTNGPLPAVGAATLTSLHFDQDGPDGIVSAKYSGALKSVSWRVHGNGWIQCDYTYTATGTNNYFGVLFDYPENLVKHKRWFGDGPFRVWKNRLRGVTLNVWENDYNNTLTGYRDWIYPEFKGFFSNVRWLHLDTDEGQITVVNNSNIPFVQVLTPEFPPANLVAKTLVSVPKCGLGFLDAIPAVGSKFKDATFTGPQGQPNLATGEYSGSVSFYFGKLP